MFDARKLRVLLPARVIGMQLREENRPVTLLGSIDSRGRCTPRLVQAEFPIFPGRSFRRSSEYDPEHFAHVLYEPLQKKQGFGFVVSFVKSKPDSRFVALVRDALATPTDCAGI